MAKNYEQFNYKYNLLLNRNSLSSFALAFLREITNLNNTSVKS